MDFGDIVSKNLELLSEDDNIKLKKLQDESTLSLISFINQQKKNSFIKKIIRNILEENNELLLDITITDIDELSNNDMELLGLENLELLTFEFEGKELDLYDFLHEYQSYEKCFRFYKKIHSLGATFTEDNFYYFCNIGCDKLLVDFYLSNIITYVDTDKLTIDNHVVMKRIIELNKYDRNTIDSIYNQFKEKPDSVAFCYNELLKNGYIFNNNYIVLIVFVEAIYYNIKILKHPEMNKYIINKVFKINITKNDLIKCLEYGDSIDIMLDKIDYYKEILNKDKYKNKYYNKAEIIYLE